jgi:hypothetical protein
MDNQHFQRLVLFTIVLPLMYMISSCSILDPERLVSTENEYFSFDPHNILLSLESDRIDIFAESSNSYRSNPLSGPVQWNEGDYLRLASAIHESVWDESLEKWELRKVSYGMHCNDLDNGFQDAIYTFYKIDRIRKQNSRLVSELIINPRKSYARVEKNEYYPQRNRWATINLGDLVISAESAIEIAEKAGGSQTREKVENKCEIFVSLNPDLGKYEGWQVVYTPDSTGYLLDVFNVNPFTGELETRN